MSGLLMEHDGTITLFSSLINLAVRLYCHLTFDSHTTQLCKASFHHLKSISEVCPVLSENQVQTFYPLQA